jgi:hypothetical protein
VLETPGENREGPPREEIEYVRALHARGMRKAAKATPAKAKRSRRPA